MSDLETFAPTPRIVTLNNGQDVEILPLRLGQMPAFTKAAKVIAGSLFVADYFTILEDHPEAAIDVLVAAGLKRETVVQLAQDETVNLLSAIYEVNGDFFIRRLRPAMTRAATAAKAAIAAMQVDGVSSSPTSAATDTASPPV